MRTLCSSVAVLLLAVTGASQAIDIGATQPGTVRASSSLANGSVRTPAQEDAYVQMQANFWGLSTDDIRRAQLLMQGPRGAFSAPNISPVEILGIHARSDAERQKYAELFARISHADTELVLAWVRASGMARDKLYPNEPVIAYGSSAHPAVDPADAQAAMVPQSAITPRPTSKSTNNGRQ